MGAFLVWAGYISLRCILKTSRVSDNKAFSKKKFGGFILIILIFIVASVVGGLGR